MTNLGRHRDGLMTARTALGIVPTSGHAHYVHSICLWNTGRRDEAIAAIKTAEEFEPITGTYPATKSWFYTQLNQHHDALLAIEQAIGNEPNEASRHAARSRALRKVNRREDALVSAETAVALNPESAVSHAALGSSLLSFQEYDRAAVVLREAMRLDPTSQQTRLELVEAIRHRSLLFRMTVEPMERIAGMVERAGARFARAKAIALFVGLAFALLVLRMMVIGVIPVEYVVGFCAFLLPAVIVVGVMKFVLRHVAIFLLQRDDEVRPLISEERYVANVVVMTLLTLPLVVGMIALAVWRGSAPLGFMGVPPLGVWMFYAASAMTSWPGPMNSRHWFFWGAIVASMVPGAAMFYLPKLVDGAQIVGPITAAIVAVAISQREKKVEK